MKRLKTVWLRNQIKPLAAWRGMRELLKNPDDTTQVFHIIEALKGDSLGAAVRRLRSSDRGRALLQKKPDIVSKLNDREWLLSLPAGTRCAYRTPKGAAITAPAMMGRTASRSIQPNMVMGDVGGEDRA